jgi:TatD DNase family protein
MYTDSHCHLSFPELAAQLPDVRLKMQEAHVTRALCICTTIEEFDKVHALAKTYDNFWSTVGVHPDNEDIYEPTIEDLIQKASLPRVVAIGETGLDYFQMEERKGGRSIGDMEWQRERFRTHIRAARQVALPMVIHTRASSDDTIRILKEEGEAGDSNSAGGVFTVLQKRRPLPRPRSIWAFTFLFPEF